jgi:hypothetical protein
MRRAPIDGWRLARHVSALCGLVLAVSGCAGGAWLENSLEAELPINEPRSAYPTAIRASLSDDQPSDNDQPPLPVVPATEPTPIAPRPRPERQQPLLTPLATIPQELLRAPSARAPATTNSSAELALPAVESPAEPAALPTLSSALDRLPSAPFFQDLAASWPPTNPSAPPATAPAATIAASDANPTTRPSEKPLAENSVSAATPQISLEKAQEELIGALEHEIRRRRSDSKSDEDLPRLEQQLRLIYLASGRLDEAVSEVESLDAAQRDAYKDLMFGLGVWISPDESRRAPLRSAKVLHSLREATGQLAAASKLEVRNLVFCERVDHFGWYSEFPKKEFQPKQQVILYAEVENFSAEQKGSAGYETELQGSYEILDSSGQIVASRQLQLDKEVCRNYRRDYFLAYRIYMPDDISPGRYRLELTVEDLKARGKYQGRKLGDGVIEFTIR